MKIEVLTTLKGGIGELFAKGTVFVSPDIPQSVLEELAEGKDKTIRVLEEDQIANPVVAAPPEAPVLVPSPPLPKDHLKKPSRMKR